MKLTLDTNCIIDLEENRPAAPFLHTLISYHDNQKIDLRVVAISASERKPDGTYATNFAEFREKIALVSLGHVEILAPICYLDMAFVDWCLLADEQMVKLERKIHEILFPRIDFEYGTYCKIHGIDPNDEKIDARWRNAKCDVLAIWCHITNGGDIFVTSDRNFHRPAKKTQLIQLGAGDILTTPYRILCNGTEQKSLEA